VIEKPAWWDILIASQSPDDFADRRLAAMSKEERLTYPDDDEDALERLRVEFAEFLDALDEEDDADNDRT